MSVDRRDDDLAWIRSYAPTQTAAMDDSQALDFADRVREEHLQYTAEALDGKDSNDDSADDGTEL